MPTAADNRRWIIEQWQYLYGRMPTAIEVDYNVAALNAGQPRSQWMTNAEKVGINEAVTRIYQDTLGREPTAAELLWNRNYILAGRSTRRTIADALAASTEGMLREAQPAPPTADQENARDIINGLLEQYGLSGLGDWAWQQILDGHTDTRILQDLRETDQYKQRFQGMTLRREAGLNAMTEGEYIAYENSARQMMRAAGLPSDFYDSPEDFARFIGDDVSVAELNQRVSEGYAAAAQAPAEVRAELKRLYGIDEGQLAAYFLDPDRALPLIQRQFSASQISGAAQRSLYGPLGIAEAERLSSLGITEREAQQGFGQLAQSKELFGPMIGTDETAIGREQQQAAVFAGDAEAQAAIEKRAKERVSAGSGAQSFALGQGGVSALQR